MWNLRQCILNIHIHQDHVNHKDIYNLPSVRVDESAYNMPTNY